MQVPVWKTDEQMDPSSPVGAWGSAGTLGRTTEGRAPPGPPGGFLGGGVAELRSSVGLSKGSGGMGEPEVSPDPLPSLAWCPPTTAA